MDQNGQPNELVKELLTISLFIKL
jgi:hypothetical protein